jgi:hypothetical protein
MATDGDPTEDGAHLGYGMAAALSGAIGGDTPKKRMDVTEMREYIESAPDEPKDYDECGRVIAKLVLRFLERHPEASDMPAESAHEWPKKPDGSTDWDAKPTITRMGLFEYIEQAEPGYGGDVFGDMTGFQWGWGVNAARRCLELPPVSNPAILTIGG